MQSHTINVELNETQTQNYDNIDDNQSSSFAEINETQTPDWEEVA